MAKEVWRKRALAASSTEAGCRPAVRQHHKLGVKLPMKAYHDDDGQPPRAFYADRVARRLTAELLGLCKGVICDGSVTDDEAAGLKRWLAGHPDALHEYPGGILAERLLRIFADGCIDSAEREELNELLLDLTGDTDGHDQPTSTSRPGCPLMIHRP